MTEVNQEPHFFLTIPTHVVENPKIDDSTAILYGRIMSLTKSKGYCFASDKYLAEMSGVSTQEIGKRLLTLERCGYIRRETQKVGLRWDRKIYPNLNYEHSTGRTRTRQTEDIEPAIRRKEQKKIEQKKNNNPDVVIPSYLMKLEIPDTLRIKLMKDHSADKIEKAVKRTLAWKNRENDSMGINTVLSQWDTWQDNDSVQSRLESNVEYLATLVKYDGKELKGTRIVVGTSYVEFSGGMMCEEMGIRQKDFKELVKAKLKKIGIKE